MSQVFLAGLNRSLPSLTLHRTPLYLRFVIDEGGLNKLDALDQLDDEARPGEVIYPAKCRSRTTIHVSRTDSDGKRRGRWEKHETYTVITCPLTQAELADNAKWQEWCEVQEKPA